MSENTKQATVENEVAALERELAEAKAKLEQARAEREERQRTERLRAERDRIVRLKQNETVFEELESQHGMDRLRRIDTDDGSMLVVKRPAPVAFKRFQQSKTTVDDCNALVLSCLVHPTREEYNKLVEQWPAKTVEAANAACELAGIRRRELEGK